MGLMAFVVDEGQPTRARIWRAGWLIAFILAGSAFAVLLLTGLVGLALDGLARNAVNMALVLMPAGVWWLAYYRPTRRAGAVLPSILWLVLGGALLTNGVAVPIVHDVFEIDRWLVTAPGSTRIIAYTLIVGFLQEYLKWAAVRYTVFPDAFRERGDGVAYGVAVSVGAAGILNLHAFTTKGSMPLDAAAIHVAETALSQMAFGAVNGYFLSSARFSRQELPPWWFAFGIGVTALLNGLYVVFRGGVIVSGFGIGRTANTPILGLALVTALALGAFFVLGFLNQQAEARDAASPGVVRYR